MTNRNKEAIIAIILQKEIGLDPVTACEQAAGLVGANPPFVLCDDIHEFTRQIIVVESKPPEFGHTFHNAGDAHIDSWGAGPFRVTVDGEIYEFEDSDRFGPVHCEDGEPSGYQIMESSNFWPAWAAWKAQGRRVAEDGITCLWEPE